MSYQPDSLRPGPGAAQPGVPQPDSQGPRPNTSQHAPDPVGPSGLTAAEEAQHRQMVLGGTGLLVVPILLAIILSAVDAPIDPKFTAPVLSALLIAGAATLGKAHRFKRDTRRR
ncbi:hypothetical protein [Glycomyces sp. YM15]|uniref:hypothetical protein n=1 Tax=Glycomyces sp. YM15 TaxID=2800446 RepID=UPI00196245A3|nr:hypothetical protein [Glycomyces sp. YM15]